MCFEIKKMQPQDAKGMAEIERQVFSQPWSEQGFLSALQSPDTLYLIVWKDGRIIGYCGFLQSFEEADVTNVVVKEEWRGRGVGRRMLKELMDQGKKRGVERYTLEVRTGKTAAIKLYENLGFESVGIRKDFYEFPREDALIMWTS